MNSKRCKNLAGFCTLYRFKHHAHSHTHTHTRIHTYGSRKTQARGPCFPQHSTTGIYEQHQRCAREGVHQGRRTGKYLRDQRSYQPYCNHQLFMRFDRSILRSPRKTKGKRKLKRWCRSPRNDVCAQRSTSVQRYILSMYLLQHCR